MALIAQDHGDTIGSVIKKHAGMTSGFDYLRIGLAISIVLWHGIWTTRGNDMDIWHGFFRPLPALMLPMFFCLSGFLVSGSLIRTPSIKDFLLLRAIRIVPALMVETFLCAILLGTMLTTLPLNEYFSGKEFYQYFFNIVGFVHYLLPGLFMDNPVKGVVNINLWTLPAELYCYVGLSLLTIFKIIQKPRLLAWFMPVLIAVGTAYIFRHSDVAQYGRPSAITLLVSFLMGITFYFLKDSIPYSKAYFWSAVVIAVVILFRAEGQFLALPFVAYITVYLGLQNPPKKSYLMRGDYSYGLYLFGFPLQQVYAHFFLPQTNGLGPYGNWLGSVVFGLTFGLLYAYFSWNVVEKPILKNKNKIIANINKLIPKKFSQPAVTKAVSASAASGK